MNTRPRLTQDIKYDIRGNDNTKKKIPNCLLCVKCVKNEKLSNPRSG